jgi:hypothetical protein
MGYAVSWWNEDLVQQHLQDAQLPIWVSLAKRKTETFREVLGRSRAPKATTALLDICDHFVQRFTRGATRPWMLPSGTQGHFGAGTTFSGAKEPLSHLYMKCLAHTWRSISGSRSSMKLPQQRMQGPVRLLQPTELRPPHCSASQTFHS